MQRQCSGCRGCRVMDALTAAVNGALITFVYVHDSFGFDIPQVKLRVAFAAPALLLLLRVASTLVAAVRCCARGCKCHGAGESGTQSGNLRLFALRTLQDSALTLALALQLGAFFVYFLWIPNQSECDGELARMRVA